MRIHFDTLEYDQDEAGQTAAQDDAGAIIAALQDRYFFHSSISVLTAQAAMAHRATDAALAAAVPPPPPATGGVLHAGMQPDTSVSVMVAPAPSPAPTASIPSATDGPTEFGGNLFDKRGMPWDERAHSGAKTLAANGSWRTRKGVTPVTLAGIEAELMAKVQRGEIAAPGVTAAPTPAPAPPPPPPATLADAVALNAAAPEDEPAAVAPAPAPPPPPAAAPTQTPFTAIAKRVNELQKDGSIDANDVANAVAAVGLSSFADLMANQDKIAAFEVMINTAAA